MSIADYIVFGFVDGIDIQKNINLAFSKRHYRDKQK